MIRHRRFSPVGHDFTYPIYMLCLDLDELDNITNMKPWFNPAGRGLLRFKRQDYLFDKHSAIKQAVIDQAKSLGCTQQISRVYMLCQVRCLGLYFSPVNFYYLYDEQGLHSMLAEVNNTPWGEKHCYLIPAHEPDFEHPKAFHVSPFMDLNMNYRWAIEPPAEKLRIHIENWRDEKLFDATLTLQRREFSAQQLRRTLIQWPAMSFSIVKGIYWQALRLFLKAIPFQPHPGR
jgi:DUF1365 family protein